MSYIIWKEYVECLKSTYDDYWDIVMTTGVGIFMTIITPLIILVDILLSPIYLVALIFKKNFR